MLRATLHRKRMEFGLGSYATSASTRSKQASGKIETALTLKAARRKGMAWRVIADGIDPRAEKKRKRSELADQYPPGIAVGRNNFHQTLFIYKNVYSQFEQGSMPENVWLAKLEALAFFYNQCNYRDIMTIRKYFFPLGLVEVIDSLSYDCEG